MLIYKAIINSYLITYGIIVNYTCWKNIGNLVLALFQFSIADSLRLSGKYAILKYRFKLTTILIFN